MPAEMPRAAKASSASGQSADSFLTPPFGWALSFLRGVAPPQITAAYLRRHRSLCRVAGAGRGVVLYFPAIATWLPKPIGW